MTTLIPKFDVMNGALVPTGAINRPINEKFLEKVSVKDFGAIGDGTTDDTVAIQNALDYAISTSKYLEIVDGNFLVSNVVIDGVANGLCIFGSGSLIGKTTGTYESVLTIKNSVDIVITGRLGVSASYNTGYDCAIAVYQEGAGATSLLMFDNVVVGNAKIGWKFGKLTEPNVVLSEITIKGGYTYGCPQCVQALGGETVINFIGTILNSNTGSGTGAWLSLPRIVIQSQGAYVGVTTGEMLLVDNTTGAAVVIDPIAYPGIGNIYGSVVCNQVLMESASQYLVIRNLDSLTPIISGGATRFTNCSGYHAGNFAAMVTITALYAGIVSFLNNNFYAGSVRTIGNIDAIGNTSCNIYCDAQSFGKNFVQGLGAIIGGIVHFDERVILEVKDCNGQTLPLNTATTLIWTASANTADTARFINDYDDTTGVFTVPVGGLKSVAITTVLRTTQSTQPLNLSIGSNGATTAAYGSTGLSGFVRQTFELGDIAAGTELYVIATQGGIASVTNGGQYESMIITARN